MRIPFLLSLSLFASGLAAQSPLATGLTANNQGNTGGGLYFDLQVNSTVSITQINSWIGYTQSTTAGNLALELWLGPSTYIGNVTNASLWTPVATATATGYTPIANTYQNLPFMFTSPVTLGPGTYGVALKSQTTVTAPAGTVAWSHGYTNGLTCTSTSVPGSCTNTLFANAEMTIRGGAAQNAFLTGSIFTPRMWGGSLHYTNGGTPISIAAWENYGAGCNKGRTSFHETFPNPIGFDLSGAAGSTITLGLGAGYTVTAGGTPYTAPGATAVAATLATHNENFLVSTVLGAPLTVPILYPDGLGGIGFADDLEVSTDGYVTPILTATPVNNPWALPSAASPASFYGGAPRWALYWKDVEPANPATTSGLGTITVELDAANNLIISWNAVRDCAGTTYNTTNATSSYQIAFLSTGSVEYRYGPNMSLGGGGNFPVMVGWTTGNAAIENEQDISLSLSTTGFATQSMDSQELTQIMSARPRLGTTPNFVAENAPAGTLFGISLMSFLQINPGVSLAGFGAPGCFQYQGAEVTQAIFVVNNGSFVQPFPIPNVIAYNGTVVLSQSACFTPGANQLGALFSNGTRMLIGSL